MLKFSAGQHYINEVITDPYIRGEGSSVTTVYCKGIHLDDSKKNMDIRGVKFVGDGTGIGLHTSARDTAILDDVHICNFLEQMIVEHTGTGTNTTDNYYKMWFHNYTNLFLYDEEVMNKNSKDRETKGLQLLYTGIKPAQGSWYDHFNFANTISINKGYIKGHHPFLLDGMTATTLNQVYLETSTENAPFVMTDRSAGCDMFGCHLENKNRSVLMKIHDLKWCRVRAFGSGMSSILYDGRIEEKGIKVDRNNPRHKYIQFYPSNYFTA